MTGRQLLRRSVAIWVLLELLAAAQVRGPDGVTVLFSWVRGAVRPVAEVGRYLATSGSDLRVGFADSRRLAAENSRLRMEAERLATKTAILQADLEAVLQATAALQDLPRFVKLPARCVFRDLGSGLMQVVTGNADSPATVSLDMPVVGPGGLVGRVFRIDDHRSCWIQTVTNAAAAVAVASADGRIRGLAEGTGGPHLDVRFVSRRTTIMVGDALFTSGSDGIYPPGLPVAEVSRVRESPDPFLDILATPFVNLGGLQSVWLVDVGEATPHLEQE